MTRIGTPRPERLASLVLAGWCVVASGVALAQVKDYVPVTEQRLLDPAPADWMMFSRTHDNQRFSPLDQINRQNVGTLRMAWARGLPPGVTENIPIVYRGVMYVAIAPAGVLALDGTDGDVIWQYRRELPSDIAKFVSPVGRARTLALFDDLVFYAAPDGFLVGLDARDGSVRWETRVHDYTQETQHTSGATVSGGKVITGRNCGLLREDCFIAAHDARTGRLLWRFHTVPGAGEPGDETWGNMPPEKRSASPWGLPGAYDAVRKRLYWGIANPNPHTRMKRHNGNPDAIPRSAPSALYSNSTVALDLETGKLVWYYQHLPGDDWDSDHVQDRIIFRTTFEPDPAAVKWINPRIARGEARDVVVEVGEPGGLWVLDRDNGQFLWAMPFPFDTPYFHISHIDVESGTTHLNWEQVMKADGERNTVCYSNTKSYWPMAYHPGKNALFVPYQDVCSARTGDMNTPDGHVRTNIFRPGSNPDAHTGIAKVDMRTGRIQHLYTQRFPGNSAVLLTAGDLIFWGDMNRRFRAFDIDSGKVLWEAILGGIPQTSTITYAVNGLQYVAVATGQGASGSAGPLRLFPELDTPRDHNAIYVFALSSGTPAGSPAGSAVR
jgi:alcohol dehydrogenase (cytochrome c)